MFPIDLFWRAALCWHRPPLPAESKHPIPMTGSAHTPVDRLRVRTLTITGAAPGKDGQP